MNRFKSLLPAIGVFLLFSCFFVGCVLSFIGENMHQPPTVNENKCAEVIYFDVLKERFDTTYSNATFYKDQLIKFTTPNNKIWVSKQFVKEDTEQEDEENILWDVIVQTGERFKVSILDNKGCGIKSKMDSLIRNSNEN